MLRYGLSMKGLALGGAIGQAVLVLTASFFNTGTQYILFLLFVLANLGLAAFFLGGLAGYRIWPQQNTKWALMMAMSLLGIMFNILVCMAARDGAPSGLITVTATVGMGFTLLIGIVSWIGSRCKRS